MPKVLVRTRRQHRRLLRGERKDGGGVDYQHLSTLLWREQELLDLLLFKAEEKQYLIVTGKTRWLSRIAHEIEVVLDQLRTLEVERAAATEVTELRGLADTNREVIEGGLSAISDALLSVKSPSAGTYGSTGRSDARAHRAVTLDGAL
jgi:hypothetical protein